MQFNATFIKAGVARNTRFLGSLDEPHERVYLISEAETYTFDRIEDGRAVYTFEAPVTKKRMMEVMLSSFLLGQL